MVFVSGQSFFSPISGLQHLSAVFGAKDSAETQRSVASAMALGSTEHIGWFSSKDQVVYPQQGF